MFSCVRDIIEHISDTLADDVLFPIFHEAYGHILIDHICNVTSYAHLLSPKLINGSLNSFSLILISTGLLRHYSKKLLRGENNTESHLHAKVFSSLIICYPYDFTPLYPDVHAFFEEFFIKVA